MEEKKLGFGSVYACSRSIREVEQKSVKAGGFLHRWISKNHIVINKLLVCNGRILVNRESLEMVGVKSIFEVAPQTFCH